MQISLSLSLTSTLNRGVPAGFSLWKTASQTWRFGLQRAISPSRS